MRKTGLFAMAAALALLSAEASAQNAPFVAAWGTSQQGQAEAKIANATVRMIARVTLAGDAVRIRLDNSFGNTPVVFSKASIAPRVRGPAVAVGLVKPVMFKGQPSVTVPAGGSVTSDGVPLHVEAQQDLAVSLFVTGEAQPSQHNNAQVTSYVTENGAGDATGAADGKAFTGKTTSMYWLKGIDVQAPGASAIVAFGDSITDGTCTTLDAHDRWEDLLSQRLGLAGAKLAVVNEGIGGNTVTNAANYMPVTNSDPAVQRIERDVISHAGVSHVVLFVGTNDIRRGASAQLVIGGLKNMIEKLRAGEPKKIVVGATIIPRHVSVPGVADTGWNAEKNKIRESVNAWIRKEAGFDAVLDFDRVMASKSDPSLMEQAYNCGDGVHPSPIGYYQMGKAVDLRVFGVK